MKSKNLARIAGIVIPIASLVSGCNTIEYGAKGAAYLAKGIGKDLVEAGEYGIDRINTDDNENSRDSKNSNERVRIVHVPSDEFEQRFSTPYSNVTVVEKESTGTSSPTEEYNR